MTSLSLPYFPREMMKSTWRPGTKADDPKINAAVALLNQMHSCRYVWNPYSHSERNEKVRHRDVVWGKSTTN